MKLRLIVNKEYRPKTRFSFWLQDKLPNLRLVKGGKWESLAIRRLRQNMRDYDARMKRLNVNERNFPKVDF